MGPSTGKGLINIQQLNMESAPLDPSKLIMPGQGAGAFSPERQPAFSPSGGQ